MNLEEQNLNETESPQLNIGGSVSDVIKEGSIVWVKSSNQQIHCGRVEKIYHETNEALIMNFDVWSQWLVSFDRIVRVGVNRFGDDYNETLKQALRMHDDVGRSEQLVCDRINSPENNRCIKCGAKAGHPCYL
jgi:hypothetical protein